MLKQNEFGWLVLSRYGRVLFDGLELNEAVQLFEEYVGAFVRYHNKRAVRSTL